MRISHINTDHAREVDDLPCARLNALPKDRGEAAAHRCLDRQQLFEGLANSRPIPSRRSRLSRVDVEVAA